MLQSVALLSHNYPEQPQPMLMDAVLLIQICVLAAAH